MALAVVTTLLVASCASDDMMDGTQLPEGKYPLQISSVTMSSESTAQPWGVKTPQTRVSENTDGTGSVWEDGDMMSVQLSSTKADNTVYTADGQYTYSNGTLTAVSGKELYWQSTNAGNVTAWYSNSAYTSDNTVTLVDQSAGLAYILQATAPNATYNNSVALSFTHQLAKVRVKLTGDKAASVTSVKVKGYTSCTVIQGIVSAPATEGYISMRQPVSGGEYWEANVVPGTIDKTAFLEINGTALGVETTATTLEAGNYYNFDVKVKKKQTQATSNGDGSYTINAGDNVYIAGTVSGTITINGTADVELKNVTSNTDTPIKIVSGTPVIKVTGTNTLTTKNGTAGILLDGSDANVEITGDGTSSSSLTIQVSGTNNIFAASGIGSFGNYNSCGNIKISNIKLTVNGGTTQLGEQESGAAIGVGAGFSGSCGNITIEKSIIYATAYPGAAAIGFGQTYDGGNIPSITITDSQLYLTVTGGDGAGIGFGYNVDTDPQSIGSITITSSESESTFFADDRFKVAKGYKVGKSLTNYSQQTWQGVTFNGNTLVDGSSNGYK